MSKREDILKSEFELLKADLIKAYDKKGMRSSGKFSDSLRIEVKKDSATLFGENYSQQLETGRKAGKFPPIDSVKQWILDKGVFNKAIQDIGLSSLAFLIARKISRMGWKRQGYGGVELISDVVNESRWQKIIDQVGEGITIEYSG